MCCEAEQDYDENEHCKEVYAHFGLAYYQSGVLESGIANALLYCDFLSRWKHRLEKDGLKNFDRKLYQEEFDTYMKGQFSQTLGNLLKRLDSALGIPTDLAEMISRAKKQRDFLAHHYYRERSKDFVTRAGRDRMIAELMEIGEEFQRIDQHIQILLEPVKEKLGLRKETLEKYTAEFIRRAYAGEPVE